jgi:hypothetical protein
LSATAGPPSRRVSQCLRHTPLYGCVST